MARPVLRRHLSLFFVLCLLPAVTHSSALPGPEPKRFLSELTSARFLPPHLDDATERQIIETAYDTLASHIRNSGSLSFQVELTDFQTFYRPSFDRYTWSEMVTLPIGLTVKVDRTEARNGRFGLAGVQYKPYWSEQLDSHGQFAWRNRLEGLTVQAALDQMIETSPDWLGIKALTTYSVDIWLEGNHRSYRAAFLWIPAAAPRETRFVVQDYITEGLEEALLEKLPAMPVDRVLRPPQAHDLLLTGLRSAPAAAGTCTESNSVSDRSLTDRDSQGHSDGRHTAGLIASFRCSCESNCTQACDPSFVSKGCGEIGNLSNVGIHKVSSDSGLAAGSNSCTAANACAVKFCPGACQGITVNATVLGTGITFDFSESGVWKTELKISHSCPPCVPIDGGSTDPGTGSVGGGTSPILIDLRGNGFSFTDLGGGVRFDLDADGEAEQASWSAPKDDAFLVLDRNENGRIDDGSELFGDVTSQPHSSSPNGYLALAVFDLPGEGGNGDGRITAADPIFSALRLWQDSSHDGLSQPVELLRLEEAGVVAIDLSYVESRKHDTYGNELRYRSWVHRDQKPRKVGSVDVFFLTLD